MSWDHNRPVSMSKNHTTSRIVHPFHISSHRPPFLYAVWSFVNHFPLVRTVFSQLPLLSSQAESAREHGEWREAESDHTHWHDDISAGAWDGWGDDLTYAILGANVSTLFQCAWGCWNFDFTIRLDPSGFKLFEMVLLNALHAITEAFPFPNTYFFCEAHPAMFNDFISSYFPRLFGCDP